MVEAIKKSESEVESELRRTKNHLNQVQTEVNNLIEDVIALREEIRTMQRGDNTGFKHQNDGGWFD